MSSQPSGQKHQVDTVTRSIFLSAWLVKHEVLSRGFTGSFWNFIATSQTRIGVGCRDGFVQGKHCAKPRAHRYKLLTGHVLMNPKQVARAGVMARMWSYGPRELLASIGHPADYISTIVTTVKPARPSVVSHCKWGQPGFGAIERRCIQRTA